MPNQNSRESANDLPDCTLPYQSGSGVFSFSLILEKCIAKQKELMADLDCQISESDWKLSLDILVLLEDGITNGSELLGVESWCEACEIVDQIHDDRLRLSLANEIRNTTLKSKRAEWLEDEDNNSSPPLSVTEPMDPSFPQTENALQLTDETSGNTSEWWGRDAQLQSKADSALMSFYRASVNNARAQDRDEISEVAELIGRSVDAELYEIYRDCAVEKHLEPIPGKGCDAPRPVPSDIEKSVVNAVYSSGHRRQSPNVEMDELFRERRIPNVAKIESVNSADGTACLVGSEIAVPIWCPSSGVTIGVANAAHPQTGHFRDTAAIEMECHARHAAPPLLLDRRRSQRDFAWHPTLHGPNLQQIFAALCARAIEDVKNCDSEIQINRGMRHTIEIWHTDVQNEKAFRFTENNGGFKSYAEVPIADIKSNRSARFFLSHKIDQVSEIDLKDANLVFDLPAETKFVLYCNFKVRCTANSRSGNRARVNRGSVLFYTTGRDIESNEKWLSSVTQSIKSLAKICGEEISAYVGLHSDYVAAKTASELSLHAIDEKRGLSALLKMIQRNIAPDGAVTLLAHRGDRLVPIRSTSQLSLATRSDHHLEEPVMLGDRSLMHYDLCQYASKYPRLINQDFLDRVAEVCFCEGALTGDEDSIPFDDILFGGRAVNEGKESMPFTVLCAARNETIRSSNINVDRAVWQPYDGENDGSKASRAPRLVEQFGVDDRERRRGLYMPLTWCDSNGETQISGVIRVIRPGNALPFTLCDVDLVQAFRKPLLRFLAEDRKSILLELRDRLKKISATSSESWQHSANRFESSPDDCCEHSDPESCEAIDTTLALRWLSYSSPKSRNLRSRLQSPIVRELGIDGHVESILRDLYTAAESAGLSPRHAALLQRNHDINLPSNQKRTESKNSDAYQVRHCYSLKTRDFDVAKHSLICRLAKEESSTHLLPNSDGNQPVAMHWLDRHLNVGSVVQLVSPSSGFVELEGRRNSAIYFSFPGWSQDWPASGLVEIACDSHISLSRGLSHRSNFVLDLYHAAHRLHRIYAIVSGQLCRSEDAAFARGQASIEEVFRDIENHTFFSSRQRCAWKRIRLKACTVSHSMMGVINTACDLGGRPITSRPPIELDKWQLWKYGVRKLRGSETFSIPLYFAQFPIAWVNLQFEPFDPNSAEAWKALKRFVGLVTERWCQVCAGQSFDGNQQVTLSERFKPESTILGPSGRWFGEALIPNEHPTIGLRPEKGEKEKPDCKPGFAIPTSISAQMD